MAVLEAVDYYGLAYAQTSLQLLSTSARKTWVKQPVKVLVLTFNRTLRGYIADLAKQEIDTDDESKISVTISTFAKWHHVILATRWLAGQ